MHRILWCDAEANCRASTVDGVTDVTEKACRSGIDTLIVDVKPLGGEVLYHSGIAPRLGEVEGFVYPESFDLLQVMIDEAHPKGLQVHAAINIFSEGHREWARGPAYGHHDWQSVLYETSRELSFPDGTRMKIESVDPWKVPGEGWCALLPCQTEY